MRFAPLWPFNTCLIIGPLITLAFLPFTLSASPVTVVAVKAAPDLARGTDWNFSVTLDHADTGWEHYANRWEVWSEDGETLLGTRILHHPHVNEMPFTRSLGGVALPSGTERVLVRAYHNLSDAYSGELAVEINPRTETE